MRKSYFFLSVLILLITDNNIYSQTYFKPIGNFTEAMNIYILEVKVNGIDFVADDEVGIFDGNQCVGAVVLTKNLLEYNDLQIEPSNSGADDNSTVIKDGFKTGNAISFRLYDASENEEIPLVSSYFYTNQLVPVIPSPVFEVGGDGIFVSLIATHNYKPKAKAGTDKELFENEPGALDGSLSSDFDGSTLTYTWVDIDNLGLSATNVAQPTFTAPLVNTDTKFRVALIVNDGEKDSRPDTLIVTVKQINYPPVANAGVDLVITEGEQGELDGSSSFDPDNLDLTYSWTIEPADFVLDAPDDPITGFTAPLVIINTDYKAILTVTNTLSLSTRDTAVIKVINFNLKPIAIAGSDQEVEEGVKVTFDGSGSSDPDNAPNTSLAYQWKSVEGLTLNNSTTISPDFTTPFYLKDSTLRFVLTVNDGAQDSNPDTVLVKVKHKNLPPVAGAGADQEVDEGVKVTFDGSGSDDPDKLPIATLAYQWKSVEGLTLNNSTTVSPDFTTPFYLKDSTLRFVLIVNDGALDSNPDTVLVKVKHKNLPPVAHAGADQEVDEGVKVTFDGSGSRDPDNAPNTSLAYQWKSVEGLTLNNSATISPDFTTPFYLKDSTLRFVLTVNDGAQDSNPDTVLVKVKHKNLPPVANAGADFSANENILVQLNGSASYDLDGTMTYKWTATGITITGSTLVNPTFIAPEVHADSTITFTLTVTDNNLEIDVDAVIVTINHVNKIPVAKAGNDQEVDENVTVRLDGSKSFDPDIYDNITYNWTAPAEIMLIGENSANPTFVSPVITEEYIDYVFGLVVNDGQFDSPQDEVVVRVIHLNLPPVADAGDDFSINENVNGNLDGSKSSDFEGKPLTYLWTAPAGFVISDPTIAKPSFNPPEVQKDTTFIVFLTVNDGVRSSSPDTIKVTVRQINKKPVANAGPGLSVAENKLVQLNGTASYDFDVFDAITWLWTSLDGIVLDDVTSSTPTFNSPWLLANGTYRFELVVNDGKLDSEPDMVTITVIHANLPPVANAGVDKSMNENTTIMLSGVASSDPEGAVLTYSWSVPDGLTINDPSGATPEITAEEVHADTEYEIMLTVNDGEADNNTDTDIIKIMVYHINKSPVANAGINQAVNENVLVQLDGTASSDPDALDVITYSWTAPAGIVLNDNTSPTPDFTSPLLLADQVLKFVLVVNDGLVDSNPDEVEIHVKHANLKPKADAGGNQAMDENSSLMLTGTNSTDPEGAVLSYLWNVPAGLGIDNAAIATPTITASEVEEDTEYEIILTVNDGKTENNTDTDVIKVKVLQVNKLPVASAGVDFTVREQKPAMLDGSASYDPDALDSISFFWVAPVGIVLSDPNSPKPLFLSPGVSANTNFTFELTVTDSRKIIKSAAILPQNVDEVVVTVTPNQVPVADAGANQKVRINSLVTLHGENSSDPDGDVLTYLWTAPVEISLNDPTSANPTFVAPDSDVDKIYTFSLEVADDLGLTDSKNVTVEVTSNLPPVIITEPVVYVFEGEIVSLDASETNDPDDDVMIFDWFHSDPAFIDVVKLNNSATSVVSFVAPEVETLTYMPVILRVYDGTEDSYAIVRVYIKDIINTVPVASAGNDFSINEGDSGNLDGSASVDAEGKPVTYLWTSGYLVLDDVTSVKPGFTAPEVLADTTVLITLVVNDGRYNSAPDTVKVTIKNVNKKPVANAGNDVVVNEGEIFTLDGSGSYDPESDILNFKWSVLGWTLPVDDAVGIILKAPFVEENVMIPVLLVVNDGMLNSLADTLWLTIKQVNQIPVWSELPSGEALMGYEYSETIKVTDPDLKDVISFFAEDLPEWLVLTDNGDGTAQLSSVLIPRNESLLGTHSFIIKATDGNVTIETALVLTITIKTGVDEFSLSTVKFYPNPTYGTVNVEFNSFPEMGTTIGVFNQLGQKVLERQVKSRTNQYDLTKLPAGLYIIKITTEKASRTVNIILR